MSYEELKMEVIPFETEDIITASGNPTVGTTVVANDGTTTVVAADDTVK